MQRAAIADVQVVIAAVAERQRAGDFQALVQVLVGRRIVDRATAGEYGRAGAGHRA